jgi:FkbM family methyltransferase
MSLRALSNRIKARTPEPVWATARRAWYGALNVIHHLGPYVRTRNYCGLTFFYNRGSSIMNRLKNEPIFEEKMCVSIAHELQKKEHPVFVDVGANLGLILAYVVSKVPDVKVFAFEPGPAQRRLLEMTVAENHLDQRVTVYADGLGKEAGKAVFQTHDPRYVAGDGFIDTGRARAAHAIDVNVTTLDIWWKSENSPQVSVVKIDTEGAELWILQGAVSLLAGAAPVLYLEIEPKNLRVYPYDHMDILSFLHEHEYQLFTLDNAEVTEENFSGYIGIEDTYVARPAKHRG